MPYIGNQPAEQFTSFATQEFSTSATTSYTLDHAVTNENEIALFVNNVRQQPGSGKAYTATGTALTLSAATASTDTMYCVFLGRALQTVTPATNSITAAMVGNDLISGKDALTSSPADTDELLISDAGTLKRIDVSLIGGKNASGFLVTKSSDQSISGNTWTQVTLDQEIFDTDGVFASNAFTVPSTGNYYIFAHARINTPNGGKNVQLALYKGGSFFSGIMNDRVYANDSGHEIFMHFGGVISLTANDVITLYARSEDNAENVSGSTSGTPTGIESYTGMGAFKLIE